MKKNISEGGYIIDKEMFSKEFDFWYEKFLSDIDLDRSLSIEKNNSLGFEYKIISTIIESEKPKNILSIPNLKMRLLNLIQI